MSNMLWVCLKNKRYQNIDIVLTSPLVVIVEKKYSWSISKLVLLNHYNKQLRVAITITSDDLFVAGGSKGWRRGIGRFVIKR